MEAPAETPDFAMSNRCPKHSIEVEFYCMVCKQMICKRCVTEHNKENHQCLFLEDYGKQNLMTAFGDIVAQIKKNSEEISASPTESKAAAGALIESLKQIKGTLEQNLSALDNEIKIMERLMMSSILLPSTEELLRIIEQCQKSLEGEVQHSSGIIKSIEIIQSTKDFLTGLTNNTLELKKAKEQAAKVLSDLPLPDFIKRIEALRNDLKKISHNKLMAYTARAGQRISAKCIYGVKEQGNELMSYDLTTHVMKKTDLPLEVPAEPCVTQIGERIYLTGGGDYLSSTLEFVESTGQATRKAEMSIGKKWHTTVVLNDKEFVAIGGYNNTRKYLNICEKYNSATDSWDDMPKLKEARQSVAACVFERRDIYVFGGYSGSRHKTIERLTLSPMAPAWEIVKLADETAIPAFSCGTASQISMSEILILRGNNTADSYIYSVKGNDVRKALNLKKKDSFLLQTLCPVGEYLSVMGYNGIAHMFDIRFQSWEDVEYVLG